ncbi:MAG: WD40/YVTN/BNR-like repeat-containing protein [Acidimicrobiia bacterium]
MTDHRRHGRVFAAASRFAFDAPAEHKGGLFRLAAGAGPDAWERLDGGLPADAQVRAVAVDPTDPNRVWCGCDEGPYRSDDGGDTWHAVDLPGPYHTVWTLAFDPTDARTLYVGTGPAAVYRSTDGGAEWELLKSAAIRERLDMGFPTRLISLAVNPLDPADLWAGVEVGGMMHSTDGGQTWTDTTDGLEALAAEERWKSRLFSDTDAEGMLDIHKIALSSAAPTTAFIGLRMGVFRTDDAGAAWRSCEVGNFSPLTYCRDVRISPHDARVLYAVLSDESLGTAGSLWRSDDLGATWWRYDRAAFTPESTMMQVALSATSADEVWCATRRGDVWGTVDGGEHWQAYPLPAGGRDIYSLVIG